MTKLKILLLGALLSSAFLLQGNSISCAMSACGGNQTCLVGGQLIACTLVCQRGNIIECNDNHGFQPTP